MGNFIPQIRSIPNTNMQGELVGMASTWQKSRSFAANGKASSRYPVSSALRSFDHGDVGPASKIWHHGPVLQPPLTYIHTLLYLPMLEGGKDQ